MKFAYEIQTASFIDSAPTSFRDHAVIKAPIDRVFGAFADPSTWPNWFPTMYKAHWVSTDKEKVGADREVSLRGLGTFVERFIVWEPNKRLAFTMIEATSPLAKAIVEDFRFSEPSLGRTRVDWVFSVKPARLAAFAQPAFELLMRRIFQKGGKNLEKLLNR